MKKNLHDPSVEQLFKALLCLETIGECYEFFEDICTPNELLSIAQRYQVGEMLMENKTYKEISGVTGASTTTISRVNRLLNDDKYGFEKIRSRTLERNE